MKSWGAYGEVRQETMIRDIELRLDITNSCNLRCIMCHLPYEHKPARAMSVEEFKQATAGIMHRVNILFLSWVTEPLLNKNLPEIIAYGRACKVPCITLVSNLTLLTGELAEVFVDNGPHRINVSIDAADPQLYGIIRQRDCLKKVIENVRRIQDLKKTRHRRFPVIAFNMVLLKMNLSQLHPMIDLCVSLGIDELNLSVISVPSRYDDRSARFALKGLPPDFNLHDEVVDVTEEPSATLLKNAITEAESKGIVVSVPGRFSLMPQSGIAKRAATARYFICKAAHFPFPSIAHIGLSYVKNFLSARRAFCSYPWRQMVVTAEGEVLPCCVWDETIPLGKISDSSLDAIWNGSAVKELRERLSRGSPPELCRNCERARSKKRHGI
jgi:radical SAM protein with 4Fe4S-binding SPASM domain